MKRRAIIIGAGPAGLTAAYELLKNTDVKPVVFEATDDIGGISKTVNYKGNRMDIGGHRFFSKSDIVMNWWGEIFNIHVRDLAEAERLKLNCMLIRNRKSRILYSGNFFDYPVSLNMQTIMNLGIWNMIKIGFSYIKAKILPKKENSLENFMINRFGKELYKTFFKDYTEKVWGEPCNKINAEWGAQRIKGLSILAVLKDSFKNLFKSKKPKDISQKDVETSLITQFFYPPHGPGQLWEKVADIVKEKGAELHKNCKITKIYCDGNQITKVKWINEKTNETGFVEGDYFISTMPIKDLTNSWEGDMPDEIKEVGANLKYRDFVTVGLLMNKLDVKAAHGKKVDDNWIYIQEPNVKLGRLQIFNNWSPFLVEDSSKMWLGLEYFCNDGDEIWNKSEFEMIEFAKDELEKINVIKKEDAVDGVVVKMPKTYPAYFGSYENIDIFKEFISGFENLFLIGRNGMHRYNNMDHSMLTAMEAVKNIASNVKIKDNIWEVNADKEYHESKTKSS